MTKKRGSAENLVNRIRASTDKRLTTIAIKVKDFRKEVKATKTIGFVFLAFCLTWFPAALITYINYFDKGFIDGMSRTTMLIIFYVFFDILPIINTMINPIIYSFSNTQFRSAVEDIWRRLKGR